MKSLRSQLTIAIACIAALAIAGSMAFFHFAERRILDELGPRTLRGQTRILLSSLRVNETGKVILDIPGEWKEFYRSPGVFAYAVYDADWRPVALSSNIDKSPPVPMDFNTLLTERRHDGFVECTMAVVGGYVLVVWRLSYSAQEVLSIFFQEQKVQVLLWLASALLLVSIIWMMIGWHLRSVQLVSQAADSITDFDSPVRISTDRIGTEVVPMVEAFNTVLDRLAKCHQRERDFASVAAHELRTPLAVLDLRLQRYETSGVIDWPVVRREMRQFRHLLDQVLRLARNDPAYPQQETVCLSQPLREAAELVMPEIERVGRALSIQEIDQPVILGNRDALRSMVRNLLENALVHGVGQIRAVVKMETSPKRAQAILEISDDGPGVREADREVVFERFRRGTQNSMGAGLGLAIVRDIVAAHAGKVLFVSSERCCVRVIIPCAANERFM
ncbi:sensor histidine kinase [Bradyrhizobium sp. ORS 111]|uniref:sensor histidine kinase n=1 Tax=Bradyrhizobium sp. ORS 111 TaxID=1685958 RepID=UPI00388DED58